MTTSGMASAGRERAPALPEDRDSPIGRYTSLSFVYNPSASRLLTVFRSPTTGETETQVPSEVALRLYETMARSGRDQAPDADAPGTDARKRGESEGGFESGFPGLGGSGAGSLGLGGLGKGRSIDIVVSADSGSRSGGTGFGAAAFTAGVPVMASGAPSSSGSASAGRVDMLV